MKIMSPCMDNLRKREKELRNRKRDDFLNKMSLVFLASATTWLFIVMVQYLDR